MHNLFVSMVSSLGAAGLAALCSPHIVDYDSHSTVDLDHDFNFVPLLCQVQLGKLKIYLPPHSI
jgi:hypothetical protein